MNRRDLLKQAGTTLLATSAFGAGALAKSSNPALQSKSQQPLIVNFTGPFCFWEDAANDMITAMSAPVGLTFVAPHQPWMATSCNETQIYGNGSPLLELTGVKRQGATEHNGTEVFAYPQEPGACPSSLPPANGNCLPPLFKLNLPFPDQIVGSTPTCVLLGSSNPVRRRRPTCKSVGGSQTFVASVVSFVYNRPDYPNVKVKYANGSPFFAPDFGNDASLPMATLGIHVTPNIRPDPCHAHAQLVLNQMLAMCPWITSNDIDLCPPPVNCGAAQGEMLASKHPPVSVLFGSGDDCKVPQMMLVEPLPSKPKG